MDRAFAELRNGIALVEKDFPGADATRGPGQLLDRALVDYRAGNDVAAAHLLQDLERLVFRASSPE